MSQRALITKSGGAASFDSPSTNKRPREFGSGTTTWDDDAALRSGPASSHRKSSMAKKRRRKQIQPNQFKLDSPAVSTPGHPNVDQLIKPKQTPASQASSQDDEGEIQKENIRRGALEEIRYYQRKTGLLIGRLPFARVVKEETERYTKSNDFKWQSNALEALQEASEAYLCSVLSDAYLCTLHAKRVTLMVRDIQLARRIRGD